MPTSSTALNTVLWGVPFSGQRLHAEVQNYVSRVEAVGGTVSSTASSELNTAISASYNDLTYQDYSSKLIFLWLPVSDFAGTIVPFKGINFTNNNYVAADWDINSGIQGGGAGSGKYFLTNVFGTDLNGTDVSFGLYYLGTDDGGRNGIRGGGDLTVLIRNTTAQIGPNSVDAVDFSTQSQANSLYSATRTSLNELKGYVNGSIDFTDTTAVTQPGTSNLNLPIGASTTNGSYGGELEPSYSAAFITNTALTDDEMLSLSQLISAVQSSRSLF